MTEITQHDIDALENKNKLLLSQIQYLNDELHKVRKSYEEEKKKHEEDVEAARSDLTHMVKESVELKTQIQTLQEDLNDVEDQMISMVGNKSLRNENLALRKDIRTLTKKLGEIAEQYEMVRDEYNSALFESNELRKQSLTQKNDLLVKTNELKRAWRELEQNRADMAMMMKEYAEAKQQDDTPTNWKEMEADNRRLKSELDAVTRHNESITTLLNELRMEINRINEQNSTLPDLTDIADESQKEKMKSETLETHGVISSIFSPEDVSSCITLLLNSLGLMITDFSQSNTQELIRRVSSLLLMKKQLIAINDEATVLTHRDDQHRQALIDKEMKIDDLEQQIKNLQRQNDNLTAQISSRSSTGAMEIQQLQEKEEEIAELKKQIKSLSLETSTSQTSLLTKEKQIQSFRLSTSSVIEELEASKSQLTQQTIDLQQQVVNLTSEIADLKGMKESNEKTIATQRSLLEMKEDSIKELTKKVETLSSLSSQLRNTNDQSTSQNTIIITQLKRDIADKDKKIKELEDELDDAEDALDDEKDITAKLRKDLKDITESRDHLRNDLKEVETDNDELIEELKKANELNKQYQEKEKEYLEKLHEKDELQNQVITLKQMVSELQAYNKAKEQDIPQCERIEGPVVVYTTPEEVTEYAQEMAVMPEESNEVVELCFTNCSLENDDIAVVSTVFEMGGFANVRRMNISKNNIQLRGCTTLFQALAERGGGYDDYQKWKQDKSAKSENRNLIQVLNIGNNRIKTKGFLYLLTLIKEGKFPLLWELDVSGNELDDKCVTEMTAFLRNNPALSSLHIVNFENNAISPAVLQEFKTVLAASYSEH